MATPIRVLCVDDDPDVASMTAEFLRREGLDVVVETSAEDGLARLWEGGIDCIVSDYRMPGTDGLEFLEAVRARREDLPFILFTSKGSEEIASEAIAHGVTDYLQKGTGTDQYMMLANRIENAVSRHRAERAVDETQRWFETLIEHSTDLIAVLDSDGRFRYVSPSFEPITGFAPEELRGEQGIEYIHPDDRASVREAFERAVDDPDRIVSVEYRTATAEGDWQWVETRFRNLLSDPDVEGVVEYTRVIAERKERERRLEAERDRRDALFENTGDPMIEVEFEEGMPLISDVNGPFEEVFGFDAEEVIDAPLERTLVPEAEHGDHDDIRRHVLSGERIEREVTRSTVDGPREFVLRVTPFETDDGGIGAYGRYTDVTSRREREARVRALHDVAVDLESLDTEEAVCRRTVDAAEDVLAFDLCVANLEEDGLLVVTAASEDVPEEGAAAMSVEEGIAGKTYRTGESYLIEDVTEHEEAKPQGPYRSAISVPIGDVGVLQAVADEVGFFDEDDLELAGLLASHAAQAISRIRSEGELRAERDRFAALFENLPDPTVEYEYEEGEPIVRALNPAFEEVFGFDADDAIGRPIGELIVPPGREAEAAAIDEEVRDGERVEREVRRRTASGEHRTFRFQNVPLADSGERGYGIYIDITERKERERRLEGYETIVETVPDGVFVLDAEGTIVGGNRTAAEMLGYEYGELIQESFTRLIEAGVYQEGIVDTYTEYVREMLSSESDRERARFEQTVTVDGEERTFETHLALRPFEDEFRGTIGVVRDVTERKEYEHRLEQRNERLQEYETLVDTVPDGVFQIDEEGIVRHANEEWMRMLGGVDIEGRSFLSLVEEGIVPEGIVEEYFDILRELLSSESDREIGTIDAEIVPPEDTSEHVYEARIALLPYEETFRGSAVVVRDVTEKERKREELRRQNERLEEFASVVSHDLRNPLNVAEGWLDIAMEECDEEALSHIDDALSRMGRLIDDLLALARQGQTVAGTEPVELSRVLEDCWANVRTDAARLEVEDDLRLEADASRLRQLIENVFRNAIEHGGEPVTVRVGRLDDGFYIEDDGPGIPDDERERVFEPGYSRSEDGAGLGLTIVRRIAEAHGWSIRATAGRDGGARFEVVGVDPA